MGDLQELLTLCPVQEGVPSCQSRPDKGVIPSTHREFLRAYGAGWFDDFLWVYSEDHKNPNMNLWEVTRATHVHLETYCSDAFRNFLMRFDMTPSDLLHWGHTGNGDDLLWIPVGDPSEWMVLILAVKGREFFGVKRSSVGLILDILSRKTFCSILPSDLPGPRPSFERSPCEIR